MGLLHARAIGFLSCLSLAPLILPAAEVRGRVRDTDGQPLSDVAVVAVEQRTRVFTDHNGDFRIEATAATQLRFERPGYYSESVAYETAANSAVLEVTLTPERVLKSETKVVASRLDITKADNPAATTVVGADMLELMPRAIAIDEALMTSPGVKVDNQANGERVHLSIRGQGILSERGIRGIQVMYDGIPLNDPSGFCPDVFDVDWAGVEEVNVVRGPVAFLYGGGSSAGVIDVRTRPPGENLHGAAWVAGGSNGFYKTRGEISGSGRGVAYLLSGSRTAGDGYRNHTAFDAGNVYGRASFRPMRRLQLNPFGMGTHFFNQNAEGLNLNWGYPGEAWWKMANPDALTFNEYQRTRRVTGGTTGSYAVSDQQRLSFTFYARRTAYREPVPSSVEHRGLTAPGGSAQYEAEWASGAVRNRLAAGVDLDGQLVDSKRYPNLGDAREGPDLVANQSITQRRSGGFVTDRLAYRRWTLLTGFRYDGISNRVTDLLRAGGLDLSGSADFRRATGRVGATYRASEEITVFASWGQGFLPPATEELYANPAALGGFNQNLAPATSMGEDAGVRGSHGTRLFWEAAFFHLATQNDFERYRIPSRPLETFYGNAGNSRRFGVETEVRWLPTRRAVVTGAYTLSHFTYTDYTSQTYSGVVVGHYLPNSPRHILFVQGSYDLPGNWEVGLSSSLLSRAYIDPTNLTYVEGYGLWNGRLARTWQRRSAQVTLFVYGKNLTGKRYIAFTEPDPDGNSYQPGANREVFGGVQVRF